MAFFTRHSDDQHSQVVAERDAALDLLKAETESKLAETVRFQAEAAKVKAESDKRVALEKQVADLQAKLKSETDAKNAEAAKSKHLQEENDLLLAQLHQVQEELERYYLMNKDLESSVSGVTVSLRNARYLLMNSNLPAARGTQKRLPRL
jgi:predicted ribosome quality control (RQC) complex YloA/Tae2 family protein